MVGDNKRPLTEVEKHMTAEWREKVVLWLETIGGRWGWSMRPVSRTKSLWERIIGKITYVRKRDARRAARDFACDKGLVIVEEEG